VRVDNGDADPEAVAAIKLSLSRSVWGTELLWEALRNETLNKLPWLIGGDRNSSVTFDTMWALDPMPFHRLHRWQPKDSDWLPGHR
jgi:hypothetical protein